MNKLDINELREKFSELKPPMSKREAVVESQRCLYCYDAPCITACPTSIDVPTFIRKISTDNVYGSAKTILEANLMGASCARVCPVEELCEGACVLNHDSKPIEIGRLQRYATDYLYSKDLMPFEILEANGKKVAVVGSGPAGLSCAGELAKLGYDVTVFEKQSLAGGLSTYGIVVMREPISVSLAEVEFIKKLGVKVQTNTEITVDISSEKLLEDFDAVFLSVGMGRVPALGIKGENLAGVCDALDFIAETKLAEKEGLEQLQHLFVGDNVTVIGAGNTAIDAATVAKRLGAERVTIVYRRSDKEMPAYEFEYDFIKKEGVEFRFLSQPIEILGNNDKVKGLKCQKMQLGDADADGRRRVEAIPNSEFVLETDQVIMAIGQEKLTNIFDSFGLEQNRGYIKVNDNLQTTKEQVFAGGDCIRAVGEANTVRATQDGKIAAQGIHNWLEGKN
ncbi:MAG TPA: NAD(P)-dependent oxidoreductase [Trueperaceae bacterium]|nr:NAD(P)-dependent oxidoreductase [Trueperaceae bacterium]